MKTQQEYIKDLTEIRTMMERSTRFLSLTGWSGIMAGIYALLGAVIAWKLFYTSGNGMLHSMLNREEITGNVTGLFLLALGVLVLAIGTAILFSYRKSRRKGEKLWNQAARRLVINLSLPLITGGILILILFSKGFFSLIAPMTLIFYGLALLNASKFTYDQLKYLGMIQVALGLIATWLPGYGLLLWAIGFGVMHIVYGIYMHLKLEQ
ncbi:MAG: hypothetical protein R6U64_06110 [Bacteroidales bacterium]